MRISRMRRAVALGAVGALACMSVGAGAAFAETVIPNVTTDAVALEVGDTVQTERGLGLICVPGREKYLIGYRGTLKMAPVIAKWNELKEKGREKARELRPNWYGYDSTFAALSVSGTFEFSFKVDKNVVAVDSAKLADIAAWKTAYEAANTESAFAQHMVIDEAKAPTYDASTGKVTVFFKLKDGLTAGDLDTDYKTLTTLTIDSLPGLLSVSQDNFKAVDENAKKFLLTEPKVIGTFDPPKYTGGDWRLRFGIPMAMGSVFPLTFGQDADSVAPLVTKSTYHLTPSFRSALADEALPAAVMDRLPGEMKKQDSVVEPTSPRLGEEVKDGDNTWTFQGWERGTVSWNNDPAVSADCHKMDLVGVWSVTKPSPKPTPTVQPSPKPTPTVQPSVMPTDDPSVTPSEEPSVSPTSSSESTQSSMSATASAQPNPKARKKNPKLAVTGADVLTVAGVTAAMVLAGTGAVALRRRHS